MATKTPCLFSPKLWVISMLIVCVLYVLTWPPIEFKCAGLTNYDPWNQEYFNRTWKLHRETLEPSRLVYLYRPLNRLRDSNSGRNPIVWYWEWCRKVMYEI
jgi:hypothetical protein